MCRVEDEEQQYLNATANTTATTTTTAENGAAVVFPGAMQSSSLLSTSPNREPSWAEEADDDYLALLRKSPKGSNEDNNIIAAINEHACQTMQSCYSCSCSCMARTTSPARFITRAFLSLLLVGITVIVCLWRSGMDILQSVVHLSISMGVMHHYESNIYTEHFRSFLDKNIRPLITPDYLPFLLNNNTLLCPKAYREFIISGRPRERAALEMMHTGLELELSFRKDVAKRRKRRDPLPILIINRDESGCNTRAHHDIYDFPRLTWSVPALKHHMEWCKAVPIPSYEIWKDFSKKHTSEESWDATFALKSEQYPWENKSNLALWRGTTTYDLNYTGHDLNDTPRGRLVRLSMNHPNLIDAGFVKLNQQYENATFTDENRTLVTERMKFDDMMKYKAIIDIDGNDWSSRFPKLLCMNSVVIKIDPDYIEYFYQDLMPMVHYVPASLENLTQVAAYVLDDKNDVEMKSIVANANSWCRKKMTKNRLANDMMVQLQSYEDMLNEYLRMKDIADEALASSLLLLQYGDFIPCY